MPDGSFAVLQFGARNPWGLKIFDWLREQFLTVCVLFALAIITQCSQPKRNGCGMGYQLETLCCCCLDLVFQISKAVSPGMGISFGMEDAELKHWLNEFKDALISGITFRP